MTVRIESVTLERPKGKNYYTKLMEGRVVVNIPLGGFKNFGKHPVGINVKPGFKWYLTKFFLPTPSTITCCLQTTTQQEDSLRPKKTLAFFEGSGAFRARHCIGGTRNVALPLTECT
jgi:hypothetical protein